MERTKAADRTPEQRAKDVARAHAYYLANKETIIARTKAWQKAHAEYNREREARLRRENPERQAAATARARAWREKNAVRLQAERDARTPEQKAETARKLKEKKAADPERANWQWRHNYGLSVEQSAALRARAGGSCEICGQVNPDGRALAVDHCHATGVVRGLLCFKCNTAIGKLGDNSEGVLRAVEYLRAAERLAGQP